MVDKGFWKGMWETIEWASHIDSLVRHLNLGGATSSGREKAFEEAAKGLSGWAGWKDERAFQTAMAGLTPLEMRRVETFHAKYYSGNDWYSRLRADTQFSKYRTVLAEMGGSSHEYGSRRHTERTHRRPAGDDQSRQQRRQTPIDYTETVTEEKLSAHSSNQATIFLKRLAFVIGKAERDTKKWLDESQTTPPQGQTVEDFCNKTGLEAGAEFLAARGMPRMPRENERDWIDGFKWTVESAPHAYHVGQAGLRKLNADTVEKRKGLSWFDWFLFKLLLF